MNRYEKVRLEMEGSIRKVQPAKNFSEVIDEYAKKGYRFKQVFAPTGKNGTPKFYDIIFERIEDGKAFMYDYLQIEVDHKAKNDLLVDDYWEEVYAYDVKGWRLVDVFAPASLKGGVPKYYELVFEKEVFQAGHQHQFNEYEPYQQGLPGGQPQGIPYQELHRPSDDKEFIIPQTLPTPIRPTMPPLELEDSSPSLPIFDASPADYQESDMAKVHELPAFQEEKLNRYDEPKEPVQEAAPKHVFRDELTKEVIDKDYAKRFFNQIQKTEEKVPMASKPSNVGYVEFEDEEE